MLFSILPLFTFVLVARVVVAQPAARIPSINSRLSVVQDVDFASLPPAPEPATNAKRFAQGLPPLRPRGRKHYHTVHRNEARADKGTRVASAPRSETSPTPPEQRTCKIMVKKAYGDGTLYGYVKPSFNEYGQYGLQSSKDGALVVSFTYSAGSSSPINFHADNGPTKAYPNVGAAMTYDPSGNLDLGAGDYNYAYIVGTKETSVGPPVPDDTSFSTATGIPSAYESAIWVYNPNTNDISIQWTNADGEQFPAQILFANDGDNTLLITGDWAAYQRDTSLTYPKVALTCLVVNSS